MWYWTKVLFLILVGSLLAWVAYELITFPSISRLKNENPTTTSLIEYRKSQAISEGREPKAYMIWTPMEQISPHLQRAVLAGLLFGAVASRSVGIYFLMITLALGQIVWGIAYRANTITDGDNGHQVRPIPVFVILPYPFRLAMLNDVGLADRKPVRITRSLEHHRKYLFRSAHTGASTRTPFLQHYATFFFDLGRIE